MFSPVLKNEVSVQIRDVESVELPGMRCTSCQEKFKKSEILENVALINWGDIKSINISKVVGVLHLEISLICTEYKFASG